ncbi:MAG: TRAFs-binding domain-containing protein [Chromatiales bacterium]|jgi:tetratricopeptide (TPR) repeat protein|nr:TRAFs-binding domain-containing protein [Chromatiales bacterium]
MKHPGEANGVPSPSDLEERLARRYHESSGETGPPWEQLGESDRRVFLSRARQTIRDIRAAGYLIRRDESATPEAMADEVGPAMAGFLEDAERFLHAGEPLLAFNAVQQGLEGSPDHVRLRQLQGLALARSGDVRRANRVLQQLRDEGLNDAETLGILARTYKDLGMAAGSQEERRRQLANAYRIYGEAYLLSRRAGRLDDAYYTGINAATIALLLDSTERARQIAGEVREICLARLAGGISADMEYWVKATLAEATLVLGDYESARRSYQEAARIAGARYGDLASTRGQALLLLEHLGADSSWVSEILAAPPVLIYTGHMIDGPGRATPRFPSDAEAAVRELIRDRMAGIRPVAAYGSAACGTDILCLEAALEAGAEIHIVLPFPPAEFRRVSVDLVPGSDWGARFERLIEVADSLTVASDHHASGSTSTFEYANLLLTGSGRLRADVLGTSVVGLAIWDGHPGDGGGGTASAVQLWREQSIDVEHVDLAGLVPQAAADTGLPVGSVAAESSSDYGKGFSHEIKAMLFADAVGYSKMTEDQIPIFIEGCLGGVAALNEQSPHRPIHTETAGDGLYMVFRSVADAGLYALALSDLIHTADWVSLGLPPDLDIRIALHCGPIFCGRDPITGLEMYTGPHTSRTARIEPITPPGQVYASSAFAAVAAAMGVSGMSYRYIGRTNLAKKYGSVALFHIRRSVTPE